MSPAVLVISPKIPISACGDGLPANAEDELLLTVIVGASVPKPSAFVVPVKLLPLLVLFKSDPLNFNCPPASLIVKSPTARYRSLLLLIVSCGAPCAVILPVPCSLSASILILPPETTISGSLIAATLIWSTGISVWLPYWSNATMPAFLISRTILLNSFL